MTSMRTIAWLIILMCLISPAQGKTPWQVVLLNLTRAEDIKVLRSEFPHSSHFFVPSDPPRNLGSKQQFISAETKGFETIIATRDGIYRVDLSKSDIFESANAIEIEVNQKKIGQVRIYFPKQADCNELKGSFIKLFGNPDGKIYGWEGEMSTVSIQWEQPKSIVEINCNCSNVHRKDRQYLVDYVTFIPK